MWSPVHKDSEGQPAGPTVFDALQQLGLKLENRTFSMLTIVINHIDRIPVEN